MERQPKNTVLAYGKGGKMMNFSLNDAGINYEVALEVLGQSLQPFMQAIYEEKQKPTPSQAFIRYCEDRMAALSELQSELHPNDLDTIKRILSKEVRIF